MTGMDVVRVARTSIELHFLVRRSDCESLLARRRQPPCSAAWVSDPFRPPLSKG
jgi:hypothetical protein